MLKIKSAQDAGISHLMGVLSSTQNYAAQASQIIEQSALENQYFGLKEIQANQELMYALDGALGNNWIKIVTGEL